MFQSSIEVFAYSSTVGEPAALPLGGDPEAEAVRVDFLAHQSSLFLGVPRLVHLVGRLLAGQHIVLHGVVVVGLGIARCSTVLA